jgi:hypothetical protein
MIGGIEETSASFEARSAPRSCPTAGGREVTRVPTATRREFITLVGGALRAANAQQPALPVIGFLHGALPDGYRPTVTAFQRRLQELGYVEDQNVTIEYRWAQGHYDRLPMLAA